MLPSTRTIKAAATRRPMARSAVLAAVVFFVLGLSFTEVVYAQSSDAQGRGRDAGEVDAGASPAPFPRIADDEETIYTVQRKAYLVRNKWEITPMFAYAFNDSFVDTFGISGSVTYHVAENFGLELYGGYMFPSESELTERLFEDFNINTEIARLSKLNWAAGLGVLWSPIYGKVHILDAYLGNFAFYIGAGIGLGETQVPCLVGDALDPNRGFDELRCPQTTSGNAQGGFDLAFDDRPATLKLMGTISGGFRFHFSQSIGMKLEVKDYIYSERVFNPQSRAPTGDNAGDVTLRFSDVIRNYVFIQIGVSFLFGGGDDR